MGSPAWGGELDLRTDPCSLPSLPCGRGQVGHPGAAVLNGLGVGWGAW